MTDEPQTLRRWLLDELGYCGCWEDWPLITFRDYLRLRFSDPAESNPDYEAKCERDSEENKARWLLAEDKHVAGMAYLIEGICDRLQLTGHGSGCRYSWLTPKGKEVLAMLEAVEDWGKWTDEAQDET